MTESFAVSSNVSTAPHLGVDNPATSRAVAARPRQLWALLSAGLVGIVSLAAGLRLARFAPDSYDSNIMFAVAKSIATSFTTYVPPAADFQLRNTPHSSYGLGMSLVEAVGYAVAVHTGHNPLTFAMLGNAFLFAAVALAIWAWARAAGASEILAAAVALTVSFGTMLLAYTSTGLSEIGTALGVAIALIGVELAGRRPRVGSLIAGAGVGVAVLWRPDSALLIAPLVGIAILLRARRGGPAFVLASLPVARPPAVAGPRPGLVRAPLRASAGGGAVGLAEVAGPHGPLPGAAVRPAAPVRDGERLDGGLVVGAALPDAGDALPGPAGVRGAAARALANAVLAEPAGGRGRRRGHRGQRLGPGAGRGRAL
ncbi:MAG: hypothetical protein E6J41_26315 [Chloroflexi bacterium]|nr:MAG: hypothetical protein E6J41_26315 [Chloroflexota bacterium]